LIKDKGWKTQLRSQGKFISEASIASTSEQPDKFDQETFHNYLVKFIITDDQVGSPSATLVTVLTFPYS
jgi:hypothetical protein